MKMPKRLWLCLAVAAMLPTAARPQAVQQLTLKQAEAIALQNHPQIQAAVSLAYEAKAQVAQQRSAYYPIAYGNATGATAENDSRVTAEALNNPLIYERFGYGVTMTQLLTDFGRTHELVKSSGEHAKAAQESVVTSRADVLRAVDHAYFGVLKAQAVLSVAEETVKERQLISDQVTELMKNKLRSGLDVSFANVDLYQAQLLLVQAQNNVDDSFAELTRALGYADQKTYQLAEEPLPPPPPSDFPSLLQEAMRDRPELISQRFESDSAHSYATAERDLWFPKLTAAGTAGLTPYGADQLAPRYAAAGFNLNIPIFNGHLFGALRNEANSQARAQDQYLRDLQDRITRDVRTSWLNSNLAYQRLKLTDELLAEANQALDLATARYKLGLNSIVALTQAQLSQTQAAIEQISARYDYSTQISELNFQIGALH